MYAPRVRRLLAPVLVAAAASLVPSVARAGDVALRVVDVPLGARTLTAAPAPVRFNMLAFHWRGSGTVRYRTHRLHGHWTDWVVAGADEEDLDWTGASDAFQVRHAGTVAGVRAYIVWTRVRHGETRSLTEAGSPPIVSRSAWFANEEIVREKPRVAPALKLAIVHHTVNSNSYSRAQAAAIVRGIELYHVKGNGWDDIGYNFLVDRFGTIYEGRGGGIERNVIGAHSAGFNTGTVGVALIGNFQYAMPPKAMRDALVKLLAWRLDVAHVDPLSTVVYTSGGNWKFRAGRLVTLRTISGHRDTGPTECPGRRAYALLPAIRRSVAATGLPKLYGPVAAGALGAPVHFQARLSNPLPWAVTITDSSGATIASGTGQGTVVDWTWHAPAVQTTYVWTISAPGARPATGTIGNGKALPPPVLTLTGLANTPAVVTPNADGSMSPATLSFSLGAPAMVTARILDSTGTSIATLLNGRLPAGTETLPWDPRPVADGRYRIAVTAFGGAASATASTDLVVDHTVAGLTAAPPVFSPNHDGVDDTTTFSFTLAQSVPVRLDILSGSVIVATPFQGTLAAGPNQLTWDGSGFGSPLFDGSYAAQLTVTDALGAVAVAVPVTIAVSGAAG